MLSKGQIANDLRQRLFDEGVTAEELLDYMLGVLMLDQQITIMRDYADICGIDLEGGDEE